MRYRNCHECRHGLTWA